MSRGRWLWACLAVALCTAAGTVCVAVLRFQRCREAQDSAAEGDVDGPVLQIDKPAIDFGIVQPGSKLVGRFRLTNRGIGTLSLSDLRTSCGCAPAKLGKSALGPEESSELTVEFQLPVASGPVSHTLFFSSNDPAQPQALLSVRAMGQWAVQASEPRIEAFSIGVGETHTRAIELFSADGKPFEVPKVEASASWIRVARMAEEPHRHPFSVSIQPERVGRFEESIRFSTTVAERPVVIVSVGGEAGGPVGVAPSTVMLGTVEPGGVKQARVTIQFRGEETAIRSIAVEDRDWEVVRWESRRIGDRAAVVSMDLRVPRTPGYKRTYVLLQHGRDKEPSKVLITCLIPPQPGDSQPTPAAPSRAAPGSLPPK